MGRDLTSARQIVDAAMRFAAAEGFLVNQWPGELANACLEVWDVQPKTVLEIGVERGGWIWVMRNFCASPLRYVAVDIGFTAPWPRCKSLMSEAGVNVHEIVGSSLSEATWEKVAAALEKNSVDLLHIDGSHDPADALHDYDRYSLFVRPGGLVLMHDVFPTSGPAKTLAAILGSQRLQGIAEVKTFMETHHERPIRRMGIAMLRMMP